MCFGFLVAHLERITDEVFRWQLAETDHQAMVTIGNHSLGTGKSCDDFTTLPCVDSAELAAVTDALDAAGVEWFLTAVVPAKDVPSPDTGRLNAVAPLFTRADAARHLRLCAEPR